MSFDFAQAALLKFARAQRLAACWFEAMSDGAVSVDPQTVVVRPYGWVFRAAPPQTGGAAILVNRLDGEIRAIGSAQWLDVWLARYEAALGVHELTLPPELPAGAALVVQGAFGPIHADKRIDVGAWPENARARFNQFANPARAV